MKIVSTYGVKIKTYNHIFKETIGIYRHAVDFLIGVCLEEWDVIKKIEQNLLRQQYVERLCHSTKKNPDVVYDLDEKFYKFPSFLRRATINELLEKSLPIKATWQTGKRMTRRPVAESLLSRKPDISTRACTGEICTSVPGLTKQRSKSMSVIPETG